VTVVKLRGEYLVRNAQNHVLGLIYNVCCKWYYQTFFGSQKLEMADSFDEAHELLFKRLEQELKDMGYTT